MIDEIRESILKEIQENGVNKLERITIAAKAMIAIIGDGSFVPGESLRRGAAQLAAALK